MRAAFATESVMAEGYIDTATATHLKDNGRTTKRYWDSINSTRE